MQGWDDSTSPSNPLPVHETVAELAVFSVCASRCGEHTRQHGERAADP